MLLPLMVIFSSVIFSSGVLTLLASTYLNSIALALSSFHTFGVTVTLELLIIWTHVEDSCGLSCGLFVVLFYSMTWLYY